MTNPTNTDDQFLIRLNDEVRELVRDPQDATLRVVPPLSPIHLRERLDRLYNLATSRGRRQTVFTLDCTAPTALFVGWVYREITRREVVVMAGPPGQSLQPYAFNEPARGGPNLEPPVVQAPAHGEELHVLLTLTSNASRVSYDNWRASNPQAAQLLWINKNVVVSDGPATAAVANTLHKWITDNRPVDAPIRMFMSVPNVLAFALGRKLNALGEVALMEHNKDRSSYSDWGRFVTC